MGALCSLILLITVLSYAGYKVNVLQSKSSVDVTSAIVEGHFNSSFIFGAGQGFKIAAAVGNPYITTK